MTHGDAIPMTNYFEIDGDADENQDLLGKRTREKTANRANYCPE